MAESVELLVKQILEQMNRSETSAPSFSSPYRSSKQELLSIAEELETQYQAKICAGFIREAAEHYERRKKLKGDN